MTDNTNSQPMAIAEFHAHLDICSQCEQHPFALCPTGAALLKTAAIGAPPIERRWDR